MTHVAAPAVTAWRFFDVQVSAVVDLSPSYRRLVLSGPHLHQFADNGADQRFKLVLPDAQGGYEHLPRDPDWYAAWRRLPAEQQNPIRTYTVRGVRHDRREVDVDLVLHGDGGPASRFAGRAAVGDPLVVLGPNLEYAGEHGGLEFRPPPGHLGPQLLVADATAVPAVLQILGQLPPDAYGAAVLEVPDPRDVSHVSAPVGVEVTWVVPGEGRPGLAQRVEQALDRLGVRGDRQAGAMLQEVAEDELLWDVPEVAGAYGLYAWIAGESAQVTGLRRLLVRERGVDRRSVAFMGYWREGRPGG